MSEEDEYEFPGHSVLIVRIENGWAHRDPEEQALSFEVHVGPQAELSVIAAARAEAQELAARAGITEITEANQDDRGWLLHGSGLVVVRH